eukprot:11191909-Alexandrium_andersonii.AAC.1
MEVSSGGQQSDGRGMAIARWQWARVGVACPHGHSRRRLLRPSEPPVEHVCSGQATARSRG